MRHLAHLASRLGEGDVEAAFAAPGAFEEELQRKRRLAGSGGTFEQEQLIGGETALQDVV
jgi:hypothetical protein